MGQLAFAAKVTHVPSMFISEMPGPNHGCRQAAIDGLAEIGRRIREAGIETVVVLDTHWLVNAGYHVNATHKFEGVFTSNEFPHFIRDLPYRYAGHEALGDAIASFATERGVRTRSHHLESLDIEYGTLVPLHYMRMPETTRVVSVAGWCAFSSMPESRTVGQAIKEAIEACDDKVALIASGSMSHRIHDNAVVERGTFTISDEFYKQVDLRVLELWQAGRFKEFTAMLPTYSKTCHGEGWMHDTAMLLGALGWDAYNAPVELVTPYFESSGTGQVNAVFPIPSGTR
jgi:3,4-dihydroxyphenylacetate 2,3-dioxygenase